MQRPDALMTSSEPTTNAGGIRRQPARRPAVAAGMYQAGSGPSDAVPVSSAKGTASAGTSTSGSAASASALSSASLTSTSVSAGSVLVIGSLLAPAAPARPRVATRATPLVAAARSRRLAPGSAL